MTVNNGPNPAPSSGTGPGGLTLVAPPTGTTSSGADKYGLGVWGGQPVDPGDLPFLTSIVGQGKQTNGDSILQAFLQAPSEQVATIQHALYLAGYYPKTFTPKWGVITSQDRNAFGQAITLAGQAGAPVSSLLESQASYGAAAGIAAAQANVSQSTAKTATINMPNATDLEALATKAFQDALGRKATPKEAAQFAASYRAMSAGVQRAGNQTVYDAGTPQLTPALQNADPATLVDQAVAGTNPVQQHPDLAKLLSLGVGPDLTNQTQPASFSQQVGGLMQLGQQVATAQAGSAQQTGLTQIPVEQPISPDVAAANYARNTHPNRAAASDLANTFNQFLNIILGSGLGG